MTRGKLGRHEFWWAIAEAVAFVALVAFALSLAGC